MDDAQLHTVWQQRQFHPNISHISEPVAGLMKHTLAKRVRQLSKLAAVWDELIPPEMREHTALESFHRGVLTVLVDSSAHRFQLETLLVGGLLRELRSRFHEPLARVRLRPGQFYSIDLTGEPRYEF